MDVCFPTPLGGSCHQTNERTPAAIAGLLGRGLINAEPQAVRFRSEADMNRAVKPAGSVETDPTETSAGPPTGRCRSHYRVLV